MEKYGAAILAFGSLCAIGIILGILGLEGGFWLAGFTGFPAILLVFAGAVDSHKDHKAPPRLYR